MLASNADLGLGRALLMAAVFLLYAFALAAGVWAFAKFFHRLCGRAVGDNAASKSSPSDVGSASLLKAHQPRKRPVVFAVAIVAGVAATTGLLLYYVYPHLAEPSGRTLLIAMIGFALFVGGAIVAGVIFGTHDREYYL